MCKNHETKQALSLMSYTLFVDIIVEKNLG